MKNILRTLKYVLHYMIEYLLNLTLYKLRTEDILTNIYKHLGPFARDRTTVRIAIRTNIQLFMLIRIIKLFHYALCLDNAK